jgi:hypothetical protein
MAGITFDTRETIRPREHGLLMMPIPPSERRSGGKGMAAIASVDDPCQPTAAMPDVAAVISGAT